MEKQITICVKNNKLSADSITLIGDWSVAQLAQTIQYLAQYINTLPVKLPEKQKGLPKKGGVNNG
jgi:hypothetical protein